MTNNWRTWIEIDKKAIKKNYDLFRLFLPKKTKLMAIVKSNAYGHGLVDFSQEMERLGADWLGVDSIVEALALRQKNVKSQILTLGFTLPNKLNEAAENNIAISVSNFEMLKQIAEIRLSKPLKIHIKVDTGMHRQGFSSNDIPAVINFLKNKNFALKISLNGLFTHFAAAKNPAFPQETKKQINEFEKWRLALIKEGFIFISHACATAGTFLFPEAHFDMVRVGIGLYGLWPAKETKASFFDRYTLTPVLSWKTVVSEIKHLPKGEKIGYDLTETLARNSIIAICPIGYWHGYSRALSSIGRVIINKKYSRILGRVSMDMISIDITDIPKTKVFDEVILIGQSGKIAITADNIANLTDTSNYEIITRINPLIKRIY